MCQAQGLSHLISPGPAEEAAVCFPMEGDRGDPPGLLNFLLEKL